MYNGGYFFCLFLLFYRLLIWLRTHGWSLKMDSPLVYVLYRVFFSYSWKKTHARPTIPLLWLFNFHQSVSKDLTKCIINNRNHSKMYLFGIYVEYRLLVYTNTMIANCIKLALAEFSVCNSTWISCVSCLKKFNI